MQKFLCVFRSFRQIKSLSCKTIKMEEMAKDIFLAAVNSVKPSELITKQKFLSYSKIGKREFIEINHRESSYQLDITDKNVHIVGFGKGVLPMAVELEKIFEKTDRIAEGILSVPVGATKYHSLSAASKLRVYEGAAGNLPDNDSLQATEKIKRHISSLRDNDILLCLITGGGSALLSQPLEPITPDEKSTLIKRLSRAGATINELNAVRIAISQVKGGKLATMAKNAHKIISLIISDIINDPLELIASGPMIPYRVPVAAAAQASSPLRILEKYNLMDTLPPSIAHVMAKRNEDNQGAAPAPITDNSQVFLIGSNRVAIDAAMKRAKALNSVPVFLSAAVQGNVVDISEAFFDLVCAIQSYSSSLSRDEFINSLGHVLERLNAQADFVADLIEALNQSSPICIVSGGETVVTVNDDEGLGGRNQELALRFTQLCYRSNAVNLLPDDLLLLAAGSDGIDGNNDAAGAIGGTRILSAAAAAVGTDVADVMSDHINRNDSYRFYKNFIGKYAGDGYHIHTGITGTNIMDIHLLMIMPKAKLS